MTQIPPPPPGFTIVGAGSPPRPQARPQRQPAPQAPRYTGPLPTDARQVFPALVMQESGGRAGVQGPQTQYGRAIGRTQMLPATAQEMAGKLGVQYRPDLMSGTSPEAAAYQDRLGMAYFEQGLAETGNMRDALHYYHGGPDRSLWGPKTRAYADEVLGRVAGQDFAQVSLPQAAAVPPPPPGFSLVGEAQAADAGQPATAQSLRGRRAVIEVGDAAPVAMAGADGVFDWMNLSHEEQASLGKGDRVRVPSQEVVTLAGDPFTDVTRGSDRSGGAGVNLRSTDNLQDRAGAFVSAGAEQIPFLDEAAVGASGLLTGRGYSAERERYRDLVDDLNDTNRGSRIAGGVTGFSAGLLAPGMSGAGNFIRAGKGVDRLARAGLIGAAGGAVYGAGNSDGGLGDYAAGAATGALTGYGAGAVGQRAVDALGSVAQRALSRTPSPQRALSRAGVDLTPGQMAGGVLRRVENGLTSVPILGDAIRNAQRRGLESFDNAATNAALEPIGVTLADTAGRQGVRTADDAISNAYTRALAGTAVAADEPYRAAIAQVRNGERLTPALRRNLNALLDNTLSRFDDGPVSGDVWKQVDSELAAAIRAADKGASSAPEQRLLRDRLQEARQAVGGMMERAHPEAFAAVRQADRAAAQYRIVRDASADVGSASREGNASPATLNRAVLASGGRRGAARGENLLQDLSDDAVAVMPNNVPDSGTPLRGLLSMGTLGGGGAVAAGADPMVVGGAIGLLGLSSTAYGKTAQGLLNRIYRASDDPGAAANAMAELARLAQRYPALVPYYEAALSGLQPDAPSQSRTTPQGRQGLLAPR